MDKKKNKMEASQSQPCGVGPSDLTTGLDAEPSAAFTPGPWRVTHDATHPSNKRITSDHQAHIAKVYARDLGRDVNAEANARLIAAAPELYEALKPLAALFDKISPKAKDDACWCGQDGAVISYRDIRAARAALSKAEGRS